MARARVDEGRQIDTAGIRENLPHAIDGRDVRQTVLRPMHAEGRERPVLFQVLARHQAVTPMKIRHRRIAHEVQSGRNRRKTEGTEVLVDMAQHLRLHVAHVEITTVERVHPMPGARPWRSSGRP
ncbi:hypothetical protein D3C72_1873010 [compost metagenome]